MVRSREITVVKNGKKKGEGPEGGRCLYTRKEGTYGCEVGIPSTGMTIKGRGERKCNSLQK
jgi:hypothetical protein